MTFNIRYGLAEASVNRWENRKPLVIDRIRACDPELEDGAMYAVHYWEGTDEVFSVERV